MVMAWRTVMVVFLWVDTHVSFLNVETAGKSYDIATSQPWFNRYPNRIQTWQSNMACSIIELDGFLI